jgi:tetratricopeptide (TPR) repeat protein
MMSYVGKLTRLLRDPIEFYRSIRDQSPVGPALMLSWVSAVLFVTFYQLIEQTISVRGPGGGIWIRPRSGGGLLTSSPWGVGSALLGSITTAGMLVLFVAVLLVPTLLLLVSVYDRERRLALLLRQEYASTATAALSAASLALWIALPLLIFLYVQTPRMSRLEVRGALGWIVVLVLSIVAGQLTIAVRVLFQTPWLAAALLSLLAFLSLLALPLLMRMASFLCASPFLILLLLFLLRDRVDDFFRHSRSRESFRRSLEAATLNPADASAHYNLGLLYQQRGDRAEAARSFQRAVEIDPREIDAQYQLGRLAREENRLPEALRHFEVVIALDPTHSQREVWREVGRVYYAAGQYEDALAMFGQFLSARPSDAEGRYWCGMTYHQLGRRVEAEVEMLACVEAVRTSPDYKSRREREWRSLAETYLRGRHRPQ